MTKRILIALLLPTVALAAGGRRVGVNPAPSISGNGSSVSVTATGSTTARTLAARAADTVNVLDWNPWTDGSEANAVTNTARLQAAVTAGAGKDVIFPPGTYVVNGDVTVGDWDGGALVLPSNTRIVLMPGAVVKQTTSSSARYNVFTVPSTASNVTITGAGVIQGDRATHVYAGGGTHEWGYGIQVRGSNVKVEGVTIKDMTGDGIYIGRDAEGYPTPSNILITGVRSTNNRRQGMSVTDVDGLKAVSSSFDLSNGTAPQAGVDLEPGATTGLIVKRVEFVNCTFDNNSGNGLVASVNATDISVIGGSARNNGVIGVGASSGTLGLRVSGMTISGNPYAGILIENSADAVFTGNWLEGNGDATGSTGSGIKIAGGTRVTVVGNTFRTGGATKQRYGLDIAGSDAVRGLLNDWQAGGVTAGLITYSNTNTYLGINSDFTTGAVSIPPEYGATPGTAAAPVIRPLSGTNTGAHTYVYGLNATASDGAYTLGLGDMGAEGVLEIRGGSGGVGETLFGVRLMRGTATGGYETLADFGIDNRVRLGLPLQLNSTVAKPLCGSTSRGMLAVTPGGAGVKDAVEVCAKDAADVYSWRTIY